MDSNKESTETIGEQSGKDPKTGQFLPGNKLGGRTHGSLDFKTKWERMVDKIATQNNLTPDEIDEQLLLVGYKRAKEGDYSFYRDAMDRIHGKPIQKNETDLTSGGKPLQITFDSAFNDTPRETEENSSITSEI